MRIRTCALALLSLACASGTGSGPMFEYGPAEAPLRYGFASYQSVAVETPMGNQASHDTLETTVAITVGGVAEGGRSVTAAFETFSLRSRGDMGSRTVEGGELIGKSLSGTLRPSGRIDIAERPTLPATLTDSFDPVAFFVDLLAPMPPGGNTSAPWPVRIEATSQTAMRITGAFDGTARLAGDTTWNGVAAKIIVAEGTLQVQGSGTPSGSPAELDMKASGTSTRRYVWDPDGGVLLAGVARDSASGTIEVKGMGLTVPVKSSSNQTIAIKR